MSIAGSDLDGADCVGDWIGSEPDPETCVVIGVLVTPEIGLPMLVPFVGRCPGGHFVRAATCTHCPRSVVRRSDDPVNPSRSHGGILLVHGADELAADQFAESADPLEIRQRSDQKWKTFVTLDLVRPARRLRYREWNERPHRAGFSFLGALWAQRPCGYVATSPRGAQEARGAVAANGQGWADERCERDELPRLWRT